MPINSMLICRRLQILLPVENANRKNAHIMNYKREAQMNLPPFLLHVLTAVIISNLKHIFMHKKIQDKYRRTNNPIIYHIIFHVL